MKIAVLYSHQSILYEHYREMGIDALLDKAVEETVTYDFFANGKEKVIADAEIAAKKADDMEDTE